MAEAAKPYTVAEAGPLGSELLAVRDLIATAQSLLQAETAALDFSDIERGTDRCSW